MPAAVRRLAALALAGTALAALTACATVEPAPSPSPTTDAADAPLFATDEEALAAAVAAYEEHLQSTANILSGQLPAGVIRDSSSGPYGEQRASELEAFLGSGLRATGVTTIDSAALIETHVDAGETVVSIYACQDVSATVLLNSEGKNVTPASRDERVPLVLEFRGTSTNIKVSGNELWSGENFC
ncbi:hypothetical protein [Agromyces kandeliae]|uniref:Lipoprotein n=1 Tax=Agromyces kandeliae TaxID=2666141 RepID=A0A6L5R3C6_9MICO|nr:hypothetical protein [Agromyces kandeliae]MRX44551.1 hypothetical protein [Agromyces kandeliae]